MSSDNKIEEFVAHALAGSLVGQVAGAREITIDDLINDRSGVISALATELTTLGIDPEYTAKSVLLALAALFMENTNANIVISHLTDLLWTILGPPEGGPPPEIYRRAGIAMHLAFVGLLNSTYINDITKP
jgi:hypothetical protein